MAWKTPQASTPTTINKMAYRGLMPTLYGRPGGLVCARWLTAEDAEIAEAKKPQMDTDEHG
jgi:hypothetical protein